MFDRINGDTKLLADVLKVGHHGSAYSSSPAFIAAVRPRYAIISVGRHNLFGHPASSTLETLGRLDTCVYGTTTMRALSESAVHACAIDDNLNVCVETTTFSSPMSCM